MPDRVKYRLLESKFPELMKRIYDFAKRIAMTVASDAPEPSIEDKTTA